MEKKTLCDLELNGKKALLELNGKKALVRVDYNVPMDAGGNITDDTRITASLDTLRYLLEHGAAVILMAHLGRPKGEVNKKYSLEPVAAYLSKLLDMPVAFAHDCIGEEAEKMAAALKPGEVLMLENKMAAALKPGEVLMLENLRFHKEEEKNDLGFAEKLASLADVYINEAFRTARMLRWKALRIFCRLPQASCSKKKLNLSGVPLPIRCILMRQLSAAQKFPIKSA